MASYLRACHGRATVLQSTPPMIVDSFGMTSAKQEALVALVSFQHLQESRVSVFRDSDTGYFAADMAGSRSGANKDGDSEDEDNESTSTEEANQSSHSDNPLGTDTVQLLVQSPPKQTSEQSASSSKEDPFCKIPSQPIVDEDSDAAKVNTEAETNPANLTARKEQDIHGTSKAPQFGPSTVTAKLTHAAKQQSLSSADDAVLRKAYKQELEVPPEVHAEETLGTPRDETLQTPRDETSLEAQVEEKLETQTRLEAQVKETLETPEDETRLEVQVEETLETPEDETRLEAQVDETIETLEDETRLEAQVEETLETIEDETRLEAQVEETLETLEDETRLEAEVEETLETPEDEEPLAMPTEESLETPTEVALDHNQDLLFSDVADCCYQPVTHFTKEGLPYTLHYVDINPTDRDE